jgi:hypothetical protein
VLAVIALIALFAAGGIPARPVGGGPADDEDDDEDDDETDDETDDEPVRGSPP